ncbi:MAG: DUF2256 domain-containing protein [Halioglobus sp.]|nr:DUF2256 domain-containing protein [Halioglobus sp.]
MRTPKKRDLPRKTCPVCGRSFLWRRRWRRNWDQVRFCSKRCRQYRIIKGPSKQRTTF